MYSKRVDGVSRAENEVSYLGANLSVVQVSRLEFAECVCGLGGKKEGRKDFFAGSFFFVFRISV